MLYFYGIKVWRAKKWKSGFGFPPERRRTFRHGIHLIKFTAIRHFLSHHNYWFNIKLLIVNSQITWHDKKIPNSKRQIPNLSDDWRINFNYQWIKFQKFCVWIIYLLASSFVFWALNLHIVIYRSHTVWERENFHCFRYWFFILSPLIDRSILSSTCSTKSGNRSEFTVDFFLRKNSALPHFISNRTVGLGFK